MWPFGRKQAARVEGETRTVELAAGGTMGGGKPRAFTLPPKPASKHQTAADVLDYHCKKHSATYDRARVDGKVRIRVYLPSGDVLSGNGETTMAAVAEVVAKLEAK
jgi:hypothetical protein